jgi:hypothetical protein
LSTSAENRKENLRTSQCSEPEPAVLLLAQFEHHRRLAPVADFSRSTLKCDSMASACHRRQRRERRSEASSVSSVSSCATDAAVPRYVPGCAACDHPRHLRDPRALPRHGVLSYLTRSNQALEPTETSSCRGSAIKGASRVSPCLRGSVQRSA